MAGRLFLLVRILFRVSCGGSALSLAAIPFRVSCGGVTLSAGRDSL